jgi:membrane-bound lytic murein transglycosylase MltF
MSTWLTGSGQWIALINSMEDSYGLPHNLLARIAYEECRWRPEVINGSVKSPVGAVGMFQLMPQYFPSAGISVAADANSAAMLLESLFHRFQDWQLALASYNWGQGNVHHAIVTEGTPTLADLPAETSNYVKQIVADVPVEGCLV